MTRIFDNIVNPLGGHLQQTLREFDRVDVAVGYFNLRGWSVFDELICDKAETDSPVARILIGMTMSGPQDETLDELQTMVEANPRPEADRTIAGERKREFLAQVRNQLMRGMPTARDRATLQSLRALLSRGAVEIKVFTRRPLHGKTYVFHRVDANNPVTGFVGSSNLTAPGLTHNLELNVDVVDTEAAANLAQWFTDRWDDQFSRPVTVDMLDLIDESWATPAIRPPYEVFLKVCYDLSRDVREGLAEYSVPPEIAGMLLDFQTMAVRTLARRIVTRGGTMLGDVVGLGKTLTAVAVALMLRDEHGYMPLVICPLNLVSMWKEHLEAYELHGTVVSYSMAHTVLPTLRRYAFVIVDESHTLRNDTRRDYKAIQDYIHANESKTLLLTATPYNIRFRDVANQLALYIDDDDDLGLSPTNAIAQDPRIVDKVDGKITTLAAFRRSEDPDDWKRLMSEHLVRRTRTFIRNNFAETDSEGQEFLEFSDGQRFTFPTRVPKPLSHSFGENDPAKQMANDQTLDTLRNLSLPRYELGNYLIDELVLNSGESEFVENLRRGRGQVAGFVRTMFYKRLSSCGYSFILSLERHIARNELFIYAIEEGLPIPTGTISDKNMSDDDDPTASEVDEAENANDDPARRYAALKAAQPSGVTWIRSTLFTPELRTALDEDTSTLKTLSSEFGEWQVSRDSKFAALLALVRNTHPSEKILIFTEYKDTADYIGTQLLSAGIENIAVASGASENPTSLAQRFSPISNSLPGHNMRTVGDELRVLVATDVLSEGQNLQDAHIIVNYDLPWAIIKLIQRAGRVDRIGQQSDEVLVYSFFHESVDAVISLRQRIAQRLTDNAAAFGSDEQFFGTDGEIQAITDLYNGTMENRDEADDVDASSLAYQYWQAAERADPELAERIASMPDMIDATRKRRITDAEDGVLCFVRTQSGIEAFAWATEQNQTRLLTGHEALRAFESTPEEPGLDLRADHDELLDALVKGPLATPQVTAEGRLRGVRRQIWSRLGENLLHHTIETDSALEAIYQHPLTGEAERRLRRAIRNGVSDEDLAARISALHRDGNLVVEQRGRNDPIRIVSSMGVRP